MAGDDEGVVYLASLVSRADLALYLALGEGVVIAGYYLHLVALYLEVSTGEHYSVILYCNRVRNLADNGTKNRGADLEAAVGDKVGEVREVLATGRKHREVCLSAGDDAVELLVYLKGKLVLGKHAHGLIKTLCIDDEAALLLNGDRLKGCSYALVHIVRGNSYLTVLKSLDKDTLDRGDGVFIGYRAHRRGKHVHKG